LEFELKTRYDILFVVDDRAQVSRFGGLEADVLYAVGVKVGRKGQERTEVAALRGIDGKPARGAPLFRVPGGHHVKVPCRVHGQTRNAVGKIGGDAPVAAVNRGSRWS